VAAEPAILRGSRLSFALPARIIAGRRRSMFLRGRRAHCFLYAEKSGKGRGIVERQSMHQSASTNQYYYQTIKKYDLDVITFAAWRAPPGATPVLHSLIKIKHMVDFGTLSKKELLPTAIRARFKAVKSVGIFEVDQSYLPANNAIIKARNTLRNLVSNTRRGLIP
jgi:hypothetical protein